ncbi:MAG TPA: hypothetical protein VN580_05235 [Clostridia bacterium]|nr:hypothetical protein [Clostridia bacterium]
MNTSVFLAIFILCGLFAGCEIIGKGINYKIPSLIMAMFLILLLGGQFGIIPADIMEKSGFSGLVYSFGLPFVLAGFGSTMSLSSLKGEGRTCIIAIIAVIGILILGGAAGVTFMGMRTGIYGAIEVAGGGPAGLILLNHANEIKDTHLAALILFLMNVQLLVGYPMCSFFMKKSMKLRIKEDRIPELPDVLSKEGAVGKKSLIRIPEWMNTFYYNFAMLGLCCLIAFQFSKITGLSQYVWYILFGFLFAEIGLIGHNVLNTTGTASLLFGTMFIVICDGFLTMKITELGGVVINLIIMLAFGVIGCLIGAFVSIKIFKIDFYEAVAIGLGCMVGYPPSQKITQETMQAFREEVEVSDDVAVRLQAYYEPKIIISGIVTISMLTGILAGIAISFL